MRCKVRLVEMGKRSYHSGSSTETTVVFVPVGSDSDENKRFFQYTPNGRIELGILNETVAAKLTLGEEYYLDFTPAKV